MDPTVCKRTKPNPVYSGKGSDLVKEKVVEITEKNISNTSESVISNCNTAENINATEFSNENNLEIQTNINFDDISLCDDDESFCPEIDIILENNCNDNNKILEVLNEFNEINQSISENTENETSLNTPKVYAETVNASTKSTEELEQTLIDISMKIIIINIL